MPVRQFKDSLGNFYRYGKTGKKYYYKVGNKVSRESAKKKALKQESAIIISQFNSGKKIK